MDDLYQLIARARSPERQQRDAAFGDLVERFQDAAYAWAVGAGCDPHLAQDAAQEAFLTAFLRLEELRNPAAFPGWLKRIVHRKAVRLISPALRPQAVPGAAAASGDDPLTALTADEVRQSLHVALAGLPAQERAVAELYYPHGLSHPQVARRLGLTTAAVKKRMQRARQHLRERMGSMNPDLFDDERPSQTPSFSQELLEMLRASEPRRAFEARTEEDGRALAPEVPRVEEQLRRLAGLDDTDLRARSGELKVAARATRAAPEVDRFLPEAYALVIETLQRSETATSRPWDEGRILEAALLHRGRAVAVADWSRRAEVAALPLYLNSLRGGPVYFVTGLDDEAAQACAAFEPVGALLRCRAVVDLAGVPAKGEVLFTTVRKVGFDHLREPDSRLDFAIVDNVEHLLIDEGSTPMEVARPIDGWRPDLFPLALPAAEALVAAQDAGAGGRLYEVERYSVRLLPEGLSFARNRFPRLQPEAGSDERLANVLTQMLRALSTHRRGQDYEVVDGRVLVLSSTGEPQPTRRFSNGLHQALETKEGVEILPEREVLASITVRQLFRRFERLSGLARSTR